MYMCIREYLIVIIDKIIMMYYSLLIILSNKVSLPVKKRFNYLPVAKRVDNDLAKYGKLYSFYDGYQQIVMIGGYKLAKELYRKRSYRKIERSYPYLGYVFNKLLSECIGTNTGKKWSTMKDPLKQFFTTKSVENHYDMIKYETDQWMDDVFKNDISTFSLQNIMLDKLTIKIMSQIIYGELSDCQLEELYQLSLLHNKLMVIMGCDMKMRIPLIYKLFSTENKRIVNDFHDRWHRFNEDALSNIQPNTLIKKMIECDIYSNGNDEVLFHTLYEIMLFNLDIMIDSFANLIWNISTVDNIQNKISEELQETNVNVFENIKNLQYLNCVINESARLNPGITVTFAETITEDIVLGNQALPKNTKISLDTQMINRDPDVWNNPHSFNPDRFIGNKSSLYMFHRFGLGPRKCLGNIYGDYILKIGIASIVDKFILHPKNGGNLVQNKRNTIPNISNYDMENDIIFEKKH